MKRKRLLWLLPALAVIIALIIWFVPRNNENQKMFLTKAELLKTEIVTDEMVEALGDSPVESVGYVVFFSVCDGNTRGKVYNGSGKTLSDAWRNAAKITVKAIKDDAVEPKWVRADVVSRAWLVTPDSLFAELEDVSEGFDYHGLALNANFQTVLLEGELNGRNIYDYNDNDLSMNRLNDWLEDNGEKTLQELPEHMLGFDCWGWFCDETETVFPLCREGADTGRRQVTAIDADYAKNIIDNASSFLVDQVKEDGTFVYGIRPQYDKEIDDYNILRHSGTIWSLICRYRIFPDETLKEKIDSTIDYLLTQIRYDQDDSGYLYEAKDGEFKIGGNGIAIVTLTEYMDVFQNEKYRDVCIKLGEGILKLQDPENGSYWHIMNFDFSRAENFRTVYYDGECTFALARLYSLTGEQKWLDAACKAIDHFIEADYTQYRDHWVAYSLNEVTKYVDRQDYYDFALANAVNNYSKIEGQSRTYPTNLELLISSFETWQRMVEEGFDTGDFDVQKLLDVISARSNRQLSGYFYPEQAMYMQNPQRIVGSFMMRDDKFRVRIDDVQHNIGGFYLYWKNYDAMLAAGLNPGIMDDTK